MPDRWRVNDVQAISFGNRSVWRRTFPRRFMDQGTTNRTNRTNPDWNFHNDSPRQSPWITPTVTQNDLQSLADMKKASFVLIILGALYLLSNVRDQVRGNTTLSVPMPHPSTPLPDGSASADASNSNFEGAMIYNWFYALGLVALGFVGLSIHGHYERLDPLSPDFDADSSSSSNPIPR